MFPAGEDRWLCTLLLKQGWRVEYTAASDAYTNAPENFKELYNQVSAAADQNLSTDTVMLKSFHYVVFTSVIIKINCHL